MKKITQVMTILVCLFVFFSVKTYAANPENPGKVYISYGVNNSDSWTWNQEMTKSSDGTSYSFTVKNVEGNLRFFVHKDQKKDWNAMTADNANTVYMVSGSKGEETNDYGLNDGWNDKQVFLYGTSKHCIKIEKTGNIKVTIYWSGENAYLKYETVADEPETKSYVYAIHGQIADANNWNPVELTGTGNTRTLTYDFGETATSSDRLFGIRVCNTDITNQSDQIGWYRQGGAEYTASKKGTTFDSLSGTDGDNMKLKAGIAGKVTFTLTIGNDGMPTSLKIAGGVAEVVDPLPSDDAIIYFYDNDNCSLTTINAYVWGDNGNNNGYFPGVAMTATGKVIVKDGKKCKVWSYTHKADWTPTNVIINKGKEESDKLTYGDPVWKNGGFYTHGSAAADNATYTLVDDDVVDPEKPTALYFHVKYDLSEYGANGVNTIPRAHIFNKNTGEKREAWNDSQYMTLVDENDPDGIGKKYSLWKVDLNPGDVEKYNAVIFWFEKKDNGGVNKYGSDKLRDTGEGVYDFVNKVNPNDDANWAKYIYASYSKDVNGAKSFAAQTYLTFDEFKALHDADMKRGGRENIYLVGWGAGWYEEDANGEAVEPYIAFPGNVKDGYMEQKAVSSDNGCFYLPVAGKGGSFKISWINVNEHAEKCNLRNDSRAWTTFDLGLIGVNKDFSKGGWSPKYNRDAGLNGTVWFELNKSVPYMSYNQANWQLPDEYGKWYLIVDTHPECKTATITRFNPQPKLNLNYTGVFAAEIKDVDLANALHEVSEKLHTYAGTTPVVTKVNYAEGSAELSGMSNAQLTSHTVAWTIKANGQAIGQPVGELGTYTMSYMPVSDTGKDITLRGMYKDNTTELTFHTRTATAKMNESAKLVNPNPAEGNGTYISTSVEQDGTLRYGVYAKNLEFGFSEEPGLNYYFDFEIEDGELAHEGHKYQANFGEDTDIKFYPFGNDWSSHVKENRLFHVILDKNHTKAQLQEQYTGSVMAVYPFLINPKAKLEKVSANKAARRAANTITSVEDLQLVHMPATAALTINVTDKTPTLGVDNVAVDAEDAEAEYYNLQGVRVYGDPAPGVYVVRKGSKVEKVLVK